MASLNRDAFTGFIKDSRKRGTSQKVQNGKASCCTLLKRITELKCVNSEFKTVDTHPEKGCLKWLHVGATMEITLGKNGSLYDPAGTESWNMRIRNCDNRANVSCSSLGFLAWPLAISENSSCRYAWLIRPCITREARVSSLVVDSGPCYHPLQMWEN